MTEGTQCNANNGQVCINLPGSFKCECNEQQGFVLINGVCQSKFTCSILEDNSREYRSMKYL